MGQRGVGQDQSHAVDDACPERSRGSLQGEEGQCRAAHSGQSDCRTSAVPQGVRFRPMGLTRGCPKCDHEIEYGPGRTSRPHSQVCKNRIVSELAKTAEGQARIAAANERLDRATRELGEKYRTAVAQVENAGVEQHQTPPEISEQIEFVPIEPEVREQHAEATQAREQEYVSREVPHPADEA